MKKILTILTAFCMSIGILLSGCASSASNTIELQEDVNFELMDVLKVTNPKTNAVYYYFLAGVNNNSKQAYHMSNLSYHISDGSKDQAQMINPIDKYQSIITNDLRPDQSTSVYGYIGFPNSNEKDPGLYFPKQEKFIPFNSVKVREINDDEVVNSAEKKFTIYEDQYFSFDVDASKVKYSFKDGVSTVDGLVITYTNKTDRMLVVPFLTPVCTIAGLKLDNMKNGDKLKKMSLEELKKQDFKVNGMAPKTENINGETLGYQLYYLPASQSVPCNIMFEFKGVIPDFQTPSSAGGITIQINSAALGYSQVIKVSA